MNLEQKLAELRKRDQLAEEDGGKVETLCGRERSGSPQPKS
jgi:hypothetical protein